MTGKVGQHRKVSKTAHSRIRNPNSRIRNQISPVMQKVKSLLPAVKAAQHLAILIDEPLGNCQKLLCGERTENAVQLAKLLRTWMGQEVLFIVLHGCNEDWIVRYKKQLDVNASRKKLIEFQRMLDAQQSELVA